MTQRRVVPEPRLADAPLPASLDPARAAVLRGLASRGGGHIVVELADIFATTAREDVAALAAAVASADGATVDDLAHKLKGAARSLGATALADTCHRIETTVKAGSPVSAGLLADIQRETELACSALFALAASLASPPLA